MAEKQVSDSPIAMESRQSHASGLILADHPEMPSDDRTALSTDQLGEVDTDLKFGPCRAIDLYKNIHHPSIRSAAI